MKSTNPSFVCLSMLFISFAIFILLFFFSVDWTKEETFTEQENQKFWYIWFNIKNEWLWNWKNKYFEFKKPNQIIYYTESTETTTAKQQQQLKAKIKNKKRA